MLMLAVSDRAYLGNTPSILHDPLRPLNRSPRNQRFRPAQTGPVIKQIDRGFQVSRVSNGFVAKPTHRDGNPVLTPANVESTLSLVSSLLLLMA